LLSIWETIPSFLLKKQPIAFGVSSDLNLQSQSPWSLFNGTWSLFNGTWLQRPGELEHRLRFESEKINSKWNRLQGTLTFVRIPFGLAPHGDKYNIFIHIYAYIHTYIHTYIHIYTYENMHICLYILIYLHTSRSGPWCKNYIKCLYIYIHIYARIYIHTYIHTYIRTNVHIYIYIDRSTYHLDWPFIKKPIIYTFIYIHSYIYIHTYIHTHVHTCIHTCVHT